MNHPPGHHQATPRPATLPLPDRPSHPAGAPCAHTLARTAAPASTGTAATHAPKAKEATRTTALATMQFQRQPPPRPQPTVQLAPANVRFVRSAAHMAAHANTAFVATRAAAANKYTLATAQVATRQPLKLPPLRPRPQAATRQPRKLPPLRPRPSMLAGARFAPTAALAAPRAGTGSVAMHVAAAKPRTPATAQGAGQPRLPHPQLQMHQTPQLGCTNQHRAYAPAASTQTPTRWEPLLYVTVTAATTATSAKLATLSAAQGTQTRGQNSKTTTGPAKHKSTSTPLRKTSQQSKQKKRCWNAKTRTETGTKFATSSPTSSRSSTSGPGHDLQPDPAAMRVRCAIYSRMPGPRRRGMLSAHRSSFRYKLSIVSEKNVQSGLRFGFNSFSDPAQKGLHRTPICHVTAMSPRW